jgi:thiamine pyrophosphate-dependent acetolactate synthase large subunit-like protein
VSDIGVHHNWLLLYCTPSRPDSLIGSMGYGPMGFGVAGVMGAKLAAPDRPCVSVCGDGAFFMHANVLGTAVEYNLPVVWVVWVVWNNYAYASIRGLQRGYLEGRELATDFKPPDTGAPYNPDFAAMARSAGVDGVSVDRPADLADAVRAGLPPAGLILSTPTSAQTRTPRVRARGSCPAWGPAGRGSARDSYPIDGPLRRFQRRITSRSAADVHRAYRKGRGSNARFHDSR